MRRRDDHDGGGGGHRPEWLPWLTGALADRGYDLDRRGGRTRLSEDTGLSASIIARLLAGEAVSYETLLAIARGTGVPLAQLLIRTGKASPDDFALPGMEIGHVGVSSGKRLTPEEVAALAGVPDDDRPWFNTMLRRLRRDGYEEGDSATGGAAAEG
jgi:hypothetical protein